MVASTLVRALTAALSWDAYSKVELDAAEVPSPYPHSSFEGYDSHRSQARGRLRLGKYTQYCTQFTFG